MRSRKNFWQTLLSRRHHFSEVGQRPQRRASEPVYAVLTSDIHVVVTNSTKMPSNASYHGLTANMATKKCAT